MTYSCIHIGNFTFEDDGYLWTFENSSQPYSWQTRHSCTPTELTGPCGDHTYLSNLGKISRSGRDRSDRVGSGQVSTLA